MYRDGAEGTIPSSYNGIQLNAGDSITFIIISNGDAASVIEISITKVEIGELPEEEI